MAWSLGMQGWPGMWDETRMLFWAFSQSPGMQQRMEMTVTRCQQAVSWRCRFDRWKYWVVNSWLPMSCPSSPAFILARREPYQGHPMRSSCFSVFLGGEQRGSNQGSESFWTQWRTKASTAVFVPTQNATLHRIQPLILPISCLTQENRAWLKKLCLNWLLHIVMPETISLTRKLI